ncbi:MAG TPA: hypothetical protein HA263_01245, partial [Methanoregulaceae archaeon]|nr:hypothetical protein [Methanoregulaceae archaeon]
MNRGTAPDGLFARLAGWGLVRGPLAGPFDGQAVEVWLRDGEPAIAVLTEGDPDDLEGLHRIAWSLGCSRALAPHRKGDVLIRTAGPPSEPAPPRHPAPGRIDAMPVPVPGVVNALVRLAGTWRERLLRQCLAGHLDWTEADLNLAVEAPIAALLLGTAGDCVPTARMRAEIGAAGVVLDAVPPGLLALVWDIHLARGVHLAGADASVGPRPPADRAGPDRVVLRRFAAWAGTDTDGIDRVLVPACGAGRFLLAYGRWAAVHNIHLYALDPDPRAVLFAGALVEREFGSRLAYTLRASHPLVDADLYNDPLARLIPEDARARLRPADWSSLFGGIDHFDRVLIADPAVPLTRRRAVQRYIEGGYATMTAGADPALLLVEAGARRLAPGGRVFALYQASAYRVPSAVAFRRWLAPRADVLITMAGYCAVKVSAESIPTPILAGSLGEGASVMRSYPRSALDIGSWTVTDPARAALLTRLEAGGAPLGEVLLGGVRAPAPAGLDPALLIDTRARLLLLRADRRAARAIRPLIAPVDVVRFGSARAASRFAIAGPLPPRARRLALELGLEPPETDLLPPPSGPRLLFAEGAPTPAFLCDPFGRAVPTADLGTIAPADLFLAGLLHAAPVAALIAERCPGGLSVRCLARLPVRLP